MVTKRREGMLPASWRFTRSRTLEGEASRSASDRRAERAAAATSAEAIPLPATSQTMITRLPIRGSSPSSTRNTS